MASLLTSFVSIERVTKDATSSPEVKSSALHKAASSATKTSNVRCNIWLVVWIDVLRQAGVRYGV